jgi:iron complex outermembrane receptor protein
MWTITIAAAIAAATITPVHKSASSIGHLRGQVTDTAGRPIAGAQVIIQEAHRSASGDAQGHYALSEVPAGTWAISYRAVGYRPRVIRITIGEGDNTVDVTLLPSVVELPPIQTTASPLATSALESPQPLAVLQGSALRDATGSSIGAVIEMLPGMRNLATGNGIAKPVIRGLSGNRIVVLDNGIRTESQQWGEEHAPNVETATAERIEVIRGPASVLYGSDALGGVVNVVQRELPDAVGGPALITGLIHAGYSSNGEMPQGSAMLEGAVGSLGWRGTINGRQSGDVSTPGGLLANSGMSMLGGSIAAGVRTGIGTITGNYSNRAERLELHQDPADPDAEEPFQRIQTHRATLTGNLSLSGARLEVDLGYEQNRRREYADRAAETAGEVELGLQATNLVGNAHVHLVTGRNHAGVFGAQVMRTALVKFGEETLIPGNQSTSIGVYAFEQWFISAWQLSAGLRWDARTLGNDADDDLGLEAGSRSWHSVSGNVGVLRRIGESFAVVFNAGRGFRAPSAYELYADGVHEGSVRYEIGDPSLAVETSLNADLALRVQSSLVQAEFSVFRNQISDYIYLQPTNVTDPESGFLIHQAVQGDAVLRGFEAMVEYHAQPWLHLRVGADLTHGHNTTSDQPLPNIAPIRLSGSIRFEPATPGVVTDPYVELSTESHAVQRRLAPEDIATSGYQLVHVKAGTGFNIGRQRVDIDWQVRNLFDVRYRSFMSRYKLFADEAGRNIELRFTAEF